MRSSGGVESSIGRWVPNVGVEALSSVASLGRCVPVMGVGASLRRCWAPLGGGVGSTGLGRR